MTSNKIISTIILSLALLLTACSGGGKADNEQFAFLEELGITVNEKLLLPDTLTLPDIYCGDPEQTADDLKGKRLERNQ